MEELLEFANGVREAGGGNPLDALMPAVPEDASQCLIAKNLNFNCTVGSVGSDGSSWYMAVTDKAIRNRIAERFGLKKINVLDDVGLYDEEAHNTYTKIPVYAVRLPDHIGQVASDFDESTDALLWEDDLELSSIKDDATEREIQLLRDMWPYVDASVKEAYAGADFINEKGEIVI
jgi:hypothetical protein